MVANTIRLANEMADCLDKAIKSNPQDPDTIAGECNSPCLQDGLALETACCFAKGVKESL